MWELPRRLEETLPKEFCQVSEEDRPHCTPRARELPSVYLSNKVSVKEYRCALDSVACRPALGEHRMNDSMIRLLLLAGFAWIFA